MASDKNFSNRIGQNLTNRMNCIEITRVFKRGNIPWKVPDVRYIRSTGDDVHAKSSSITSHLPRNIFSVVRIKKKNPPKMNRFPRSVSKSELKSCTWFHGKFSQQSLTKFRHGLASRSVLRIKQTSTTVDCVIHLVSTVV